MDFTIYSTENAPEQSKPLLQAAEEEFGFLPNLLGEFAESPAVLEGYLTLNEIIGKTDFTPEEQQLIILAVSVENKCHYCSAVHSFLLKNQLNVSEEIVDAVRNGDPLPDEKLETLVDYTRKAVTKRGFVDEQDLQVFLDAGYSRRNILEINLIIALKTISNYTNHIADTPLDEAFKAEQIAYETA